jgi:hypothetical protein
MRMVGKLIIIGLAIVMTELVSLGTTTLLQMQLAVNLGVLAVVIEHRGRITALETVVNAEHDQ